FAVEEIADRARFVARGEGELDQVAVQKSADRPLELGGALMAGEFGAALLDLDTVGARALQKVDPQFPTAGNLDRREMVGRGRRSAGLPQHRRDCVTHLCRFTGL